MFNTTLNMRNPLRQTHQARQPRFGDLTNYPKPSLIGYAVTPDPEKCLGSFCNRTFAVSHDATTESGTRFFEVIEDNKRSFITPADRWNLVVDPQKISAEQTENFRNYITKMYG